jgi:hypothetical protein
MLFVGYRKSPVPDGYDFSESPDIEHDNRRRLFEHIEEHSEWTSDSESNRLETRLTKVERVAGQPEFDLANHANQIVSVVRPFDQCLESLIGVRHPEHVMPHRESRLRRISSRVRPVRMLRRRSISSADSGESRPAGGIPCASPSGRKNPITLPSQSHSSTACVASPREIRDGSEFSVATRDAHVQAAPVPDLLLRLRHPERRLPRPADASVMRGQRQPAGAGRGHDESIGRILVKGRRQAIHLRDDGGRDGDHLDRGR